MSTLSSLSNSIQDLSLKFEQFRAPRPTVGNEDDWWSTDNFWDWSWEDPQYDWGGDYYDPYYNDNGFYWGDVWEGLPEYNSSDLYGDTNPIDYILYYKYIINLVVFTIPYCIIGVSAVVWNLWFNIDFNRTWAEGNWWLITNTVYLLINFTIGLLDAFELPVFTHSFKITRMVVTFWAWVYNIFYFAGLFEWFDMLYIVGDKSSYDFWTVYINMFLGYNIVLHWGVVPINMFIIAKESSMEFFQFLNPEAGKSDDEVSIGLGDLETAGEDFLWFINPMTYIDMFTGFFFDEGIEHNTWGWI